MGKQEERRGEKREHAKRFSGTTKKGKKAGMGGVFPGETCTANLYRSGKNAFLPGKVAFFAFFRVEADVET